MAEGKGVAVLVPNLFLRVPVEAAVKMAGHVPVSVADAEQGFSSQAQVIVVDLEALGGDPAEAVRRLVGAGKTVLAFGPHVEGEMLASARTAGAVVLPRSVFLERLQDLLRAAIGGGEGAT